MNDLCSSVVLGLGSFARGYILLMKTLTFESVRGKVSSPGLELPLCFLMGSDAEALS